MPRFKSNYKPIELIEVSDGYGGSIEIPSRGIASAPEVNEATSLIMMASSHGGDQLAYTREDVVVAMIRSRFPEEKNTKKQDLLTDENGDPLSGPLMYALWRFFAAELGIPEDTLDLPIGKYEVPTIEVKINTGLLGGKSKDKSTEAKSKAA